MKKAIIILILVTAILALLTFNNSFVTGSGGGSATGTSVVIIAKADYIAVRIKMTIIPVNGSGINLTYPNGTQEKLTSYHKFEMLLPKTGSSTQNFGASTPGQLLLTNQNPCGATVVSNTTDQYINSLSHYSPDIVELYCLRIDGSAWVSVAYYGVAA